MQLRGLAEIFQTDFQVKFRAGNNFDYNITVSYVCVLIAKQSLTNLRSAFQTHSFDKAPPTEN